MTEQAELSLETLQDAHSTTERQYMKADLCVTCFTAAYGLIAIIDVLVFAFVAQDRLLVVGALLTGLLAMITWILGKRFVDKLYARMLRFEERIDSYLI